jgi:hypothetical protein
MAKDSGLGTIIGLGIAGVGVWFLGDVLGWWGGTAATTTTTTSTAGTTSTTAATVQLASAVTPTINNALQATFVINGASEEIAVIPNGDAYNNSGEDITATLAAEGVTPAQLYAIMAANYTPSSTTSSSTTTSSSSNSTSPSSSAGTGTRGPGAAGNAAVVNRVIAATRKIGTATGHSTGLQGLGQVMSHATRRNYVRKGAGFR